MNRLSKRTDLQVEEKDYRGIIAIIITLGYFALLGTMLFQRWTVQEIIAVAGSLSGIVGLVVGFYFGREQRKGA